MCPLVEEGTWTLLLPRTAGGREVMQLVATEMEAGEIKSCADTPTREAK